MKSQYFTIHILNLIYQFLHHLGKQMPPIEVFVFCWYQKHWLPRAVIVDYSKLTDCMKKQIELLVATGPLIEVNYQVEKKERSTFYTRKGYTDVLKNKFIELNDELDIAISTWEHHSDSLHSYYYDDSDHNDDKPNESLCEWNWIHHAYEYYINDKNSNYRPLKLHQVLSSMTSLPAKNNNENENENVDVKTIFNSNFVVKHCVLVSDVPVIDQSENENNEIDFRPIRFFYKFMNSDQIDDELKKISIVVNYDHEIPDPVNLFISETNSSQEFDLNEEMENGITKIIKNFFGVTYVDLADSDYGFLKPTTMDHNFEKVLFLLHFGENKKSLGLFFVD